MRRTLVLISALTCGLVACAQTAPAPPTNQAPPASTPPSPSAPATDAQPNQPATAAAVEQLAAGATNPTRGTEQSATSPAAPASDAAKSAPPAKPAPQFRAVTIPAGTVINVRLATSIASDKSAVEDQVRGTLTAPLVIDGVTAVPADAEIIGTVLDVKRSGRVKGRASVAFRFDRLVVRGESLAIRTARLTQEAAATPKKDVKKGAIGGAAGAIVGGIAGGGQGAAIGAAVGGAGAVVATRGDEIELPAGTTIRSTLQDPLKVIVPLSKGER